MAFASPADAVNQVRENSVQVLKILNSGDANTARQKAEVLRHPLLRLPTHDRFSRRQPMAHCDWRTKQALTKEFQNPADPHLLRHHAEIQKRQDEITKFGSDEEAALSKLMEEQDKKVAEFQELNEKRQTEERGKLLESIQVATNNLAKAKGYTYVLDANSVVFAVDGKDITEEVLKSIPATEKAAPAKTEEKK